MIKQTVYYIHVINAWLVTKYLALIYHLKERKIVYAKLLLNTLWGALTQVLERRHIIDCDGEDFNIPENMTVTMIKPSIDKKSILVDLASNDRFYVSNFARMKPFILSKGRSKISDIMLPYKDIIVKSHTDSLITTEYPTNIKIGEQMGDLVYEGFCDNIIIKSNAKEKGSDNKSAVFKV